jgi:hypothetical protein
MDEGAVVWNIRTLRPCEFFGPLLSQQLATPGFLLATWASFQVFGDNLFALRLIPLLSGVTSLFLFVSVARRSLSPEGVFPAVVMFAVASDLVYYSSEIKQYGSDVVATLACLLIGLTVGSRRLTVAKAAGLAAFGAEIVWFSHPSIFVLASVGIIGLARSVAARDRRWIGLWLVVGMAWMASFEGVHAVANRQLNGSNMMWRFWNFAFPPIPPRSLRDALWPIRRLAYYFINPLNFDVPFGPAISMLPAFGLAVLGLIRLARLDNYRLALLVLPVAFTMAASTFRLYPFHGRVILFLTPIFLIAIAAGLEAVRKSRGRGPIYYTLAAIVLVIPTASALWQAFEPNWSHNHIGDLHPDGLDPDRFPF